MLAALNILFFLFHTSLILFNVFGWAHPKTRKWNLLTLLLTLASWVGMGMVYGMGYCFCTDWHWQVREAMGIEETASSYIVLLVRNLSGWSPPIGLANAVAKWVFFAALAISVGLNVRDWVRVRRGDETGT
ncbi:MAG: DUF2784 family protein [Armatimonadetes bacterium]|nr:DUF2784 family protein [Armatimonadota bacterium]